MSAYCFFDVREITDPGKVDKYLAGVFATVAQYGGRYLVLGGPYKVVEGDWEPVYPVVVEFPDADQADRWYGSNEYRALKALRRAGTRSNAVFLDGVTSSPAQIYDALFVPALFRQWGEVVADAANISAGQRVIDIACGTGVLALAAMDRVGDGGKVVGLDKSADMLGVARRKSVRIEWREGPAESIPFPDESFDAVVSQFGLMFFDDRVAAFREMVRVLRPDGRLAVAVCDSLDHSPGYRAFAELLHRLFGERVADAFRTPFVLGDPERLLSICADAGIPNAKVAQHHGKVRFATINSLVSTERACVWTLGGMLDDAQFALLATEAERELHPFATADGFVEFDMPALFVTAVKPR